MTIAPTTTDWSARAAAMRPPDRLVLAEGLADSADGRTFANVSPIDGRHLTDVAFAGPADIDRAVTAARAAVGDGRWRNLSPAARGRLLVRLAELIEAHADELALREVLDVGKPIRDARTTDVPGAAGVFRWFGEAVGKRYGELAPTDPPVVATVTREPVGVVAAVVPWNFPLYMAAQKVAPALAAGNAVILKPAEQSPSSAIRLGELALEAGLPPAVLQVLPGDGPTTGATLGRHASVDAVSFTGSTEVGHRFLEYAATSNGKPVWSELGGLTAQVVLDDAPDLETVADAVALGAFFNQGQVCNAGARLIVDRRIHDELLDRVIAATARLRIGDPLDDATDLGTLVDEAAADRVLSEITGAVQTGAKLIIGGQRATGPTRRTALLPTVLDQVNPASRIAQEELFGPVLSVIVADGIEEAVRAANATRYSLAAALWTRDVNRVLLGARALRGGTVWVNNFDQSDITTPWGGTGATGTGRDKSLHALDQYTWLKTTWVQLDAKPSN